MAGPVVSVSGVTPLGEGRDLRMNLAGRRRMLGPWRFLTLAVFLGVTAAWIGALAIIAQYRRNDMAFALSWLAYAVVAVGAAVLARRRIGRAALARWRMRGLPVQQTVRYAIEEEALVVAGETSMLRVRWPYVSEVAPAGRYWLVAAGGQFYFVPRRFFDTPQAEVDFLGAMLAHMPPAARERSTEVRKLTMFA